MALALSYPDHARRLWALGLPLIVSHLAQLALTTTDIVMLGWYGVAELAAVSVMGGFSFILMIVGAGFAFAVMPLVAAASERGDEAEIRRSTRMGLWLSGLYFILVLPLMYWAGPILLLLGQEPVIADLAQDYARINAYAVLAGLFVFVLKSYLSALELTRIILWATLSAVFINGAVNYVLIFGRLGAPELGVRGAAFASVLSAVWTSAVLAVYALRKMPQHELFRNIWKFDPEIARKVFHLGWPIGLTNFAETGLFSAAAIMMGWLGTVPLAAHGIAIQIASLTFMVHLGLSTAATVRAGRAMARDEPVNLKRGAIVACLSSFSFSLITIVCFLAFPEFLLGLFLDPNEPQREAILRIGVGLLGMAALFQLADGAQVIALGLLRGLQDTRVPLVMAAISYWGVGVPVALIAGFSAGLGGIGIWMGLVCGLAMAAVLLHIRFWNHTAPTVQ